MYCCISLSVLCFSRLHPPCFSRLHPSPSLSLLSPKLSRASRCSHFFSLIDLSLAKCTAASLSLVLLLYSANSMNLSLSLSCCLPLSLSLIFPLCLTPWIYFSQSLSLLAVSLFAACHHCYTLSLCCLFLALSLSITLLIICLSLHCLSPLSVSHNFSSLCCLFTGGSSLSRYFPTGVTTPLPSLYLAAVTLPTGVTTPLPSLYLAAVTLSRCCLYLSAVTLYVAAQPCGHSTTLCCLSTTLCCLYLTLSRCCLFAAQPCGHSTTVCCLYLTLSPSHPVSLLSLLHAVALSRCCPSLDYLVPARLAALHCQMLLYTCRRSPPTATCPSMYNSHM